MRHHGIARIAVFVLLLHLPHAGFGQKPAPQEKPAPPEKHERPGKPGDWVVERSLWGTWTGPSSFLITSDGHFHRNDLGPKSQEGSVPQEALRKLNAAVLAARLSTWKASYGNQPCPECGSETFRLKVCGADGKWVRYSGTLNMLPQLPADMEAVRAAMDF